jgi:hypothetical protein
MDLLTLKRHGSKYHIRRNFVLGLESGLFHLCVSDIFFGYFSDTWKKKDSFMPVLGECDFMLNSLVPTSERELYKLF